MCLSTLICCPLAYISISSLTQLCPSYLAQILGFWITCGVKTMSIRHGWGWGPPQTASPIQITHIQHAWACWYAVNWHTAAALHSYTQPTRISVWGSGSLVESRWCQYVVVEADRHLKLLPTSTLDIYQVFEHIDRLSIGIQQQPYTVIPTLLGSVFGVLGSGSLLESRWCQYFMVEAVRHLKLLPPSTLDIYQVFEHIDMLSIGIQQQAYTVIPTLLG